MRKTFLKNLLRDIKKTKSRFLSIVIIIAVGVAFYAGVRATSPDMKMSGDAYFNKNNLMDFKLISTLGLTKDDVSEIGKVQGITKVEGSYSIDAVMERDKRSLVLNINSLPDENGINNIRIVSGRRPENANEAVVEEKFLREYKLKLDDIIVLKSVAVRASSARYRCRSPGSLRSSGGWHRELTIREESSWAME
jgi:putative ABC transport system permease protein